MVEVSTSILGVEKENCLQTFYDIEAAKTDYFHIDVMDGEFVENNNTDKMYEYATQIRNINNTPMDVHLMCKDVKKFVEEYISLEPNIITFHIEAIEQKEEVIKMINYIKGNNVKVGIAINPNTGIEKIIDYLPYVHMVLVMTVEPGKGGQDLIPETLIKVYALKEIIDEKGVEIDIEVDGGINEKTAKAAKLAGSNILVAGSYIIKSDNYQEKISKLKEEIKS